MIEQEAPTEPCTECGGKGGGPVRVAGDEWELQECGACDGTGNTPAPVRLGEQEAPTEPPEWSLAEWGERVSQVLQQTLRRCPRCGSDEPADRWTTRAEANGQMLDQVYERCPDRWHELPAAPQVAPEPERCHTVTVAFEDGWTAVRMACPFDVADESRPCWPQDDHGEPEPAPQDFCNWKEWFDSSGGAETMREHTLGTWPVESEWDGDAMWFSVRPVPLVEGEQG